MDLEKLLNPRSIAIVGVSSESKKVGHIVAKNLINQGFKGEVYFVNKKYSGKILDRKVYSSLLEIKKQIDLVVLATPVDVSLFLIDDIVRIGVKNVVIYAAGFKETDAAGADKEKMLKEKAQLHQINLLGPNCIGFVNTSAKINLTFLKYTCPVGNIGFISQSGALGSMMVDYFSSHKNLGVSYFISLGNKTIVDESDCLEFLLKDKNTDVIGMYLEDVRDGEKFKRIVEKVNLRKPIIILKSGATKEGSKAALSHTGGMVGDDQIYETVFKQYGAIRAENIMEFLTMLKIYSFNKVPFSKNVLVLSNAGGMGVLLTDEIIKNELSLVTISKKTELSIKKALDSNHNININNPIDILGDASAFDYKQVIDNTIKEKEVGSIIVLLTPQANTEITKTRDVIAVAQKYFIKPIYPIFMGDKSVSGSHLYFEENKIASFYSYDNLPKILNKILQRQKYVQKNELSSVLNDLERLNNDDINTVESGPFDFAQGKHAQSLQINNEIKQIISSSKNKKFLDLIDSLKIIKLLKLPLARYEVINKDTSLSFPLVAKISSDKINHKTEVGGVILNINNNEELRNAVKQLKNKGGDIVVQSMIRGREIIIGGKVDPVFGPVLIVGIGGIFTEILKDVAYRIYPFDYNEFLRMMDETKANIFLKGFRGSTPVNPRKLYDILMSLGYLMKKFKEIKEIDLNPVMISDKEIYIVDARIIFK